MFKQGKSIYQRILFSYLSIALIGIIGVTIIYMYAKNILVSDTKLQYLDALNQSQTVLDRYFKQLDEITTQFLFNDNIKHYFSKNIFDEKEADSGPFTALEIANFIEAHKPPSSIANDVFFFAKHGVCFNNNSVFRLPELYNTAFSLDKLSYEEFYEKYLNSYSYHMLLPTMTIDYNEYQDECIAYISSVPLGNKRSIDGVIMFTVKTSTILEVLERENSIKNSYYYLFDENDNLIVASPNAPKIDFSGEEIKINRKRYLLYNSHNNNNHFKLVAAVPYKGIIEKAISLRNTAVLVIFLLLLLMAFCSIGYTRINLKPIRTISAQLKGYTDDNQNEADEYTLISNAVSNIIENDQNLRQAMENNLPILKSTLAANILQGVLFSEEEIAKKLEALNIRLAGCRYLVLLVSVVGQNATTKNDIKNLSIAKIIFQNQFQQCFECLHTELSEDSFAYMVAFKEADFENDLYDVEKTINKIGDELFQKLSLVLNVAMGTFETSLNQIFHSYYSAKEALDHGIPTITEHVTWFVKSDIDKMEYYYPIEMEMRLINCFKAFQNEGVYHIIDILKNENLEKRTLTGDTGRRLLYALKSTVSRMSENITLTEKQSRSIEPLMTVFSDIVVTKDTFTRMKELLTALMEIHEQKPERDIAPAMLEYIRQNFSSPTLCRHTLAKHFNISEEYVSQYFKSQTGYQFSEYVETVRIETACELLKNGKFSIEIISQMCGYSNSTSFRRAFKRCMHTSPSTYAANEKNA